jgi:hypothetical protein
MNFSPLSTDHATSDGARNLQRVNAVGISGNDYLL